MNNNELIVVKQLPIIEEQLQLIKKESQDRVAQALALEVTTDTVKSVKSTRSELNKIFNELEQRRKLVKNQILKPYEAFENVYTECVTNIFKPADTELKNKIDDVESELKKAKRAEVEEYFTEYAASKNIDFLTFEQTNINVTLTDSLKSLKTKSSTFIDKVEEELMLIDGEEAKAEIMVEYKKTLNVAQAIAMVRNRHKAIAAEAAKQCETQAAIQEKVAHEQKVDAVLESQSLCAPTVTVEATEEPTENNLPETFAATFKVFGTLEQLKKLKNYMESEGLRYESIR